MRCLQSHRVRIGAAISHQPDDIIDYEELMGLANSVYQADVLEGTADKGTPLWAQAAHHLGEPPFGLPLVMFNAVKAVPGRVKSWGHSC